MRTTGLVDVNGVRPRKRSCSKGFPRVEPQLLPCSHLPFVLKLRPEPEVKQSAQGYTATERD